MAGRPRYNTFTMATSSNPPMPTPDRDANSAPAQVPPTAYRARMEAEMDNVYGPLPADEGGGANRGALPRDLSAEERRLLASLYRASELDRAHGVVHLFLALSLAQRLK